LNILELEAWIKTTGGRGLHIVVPIEPARNWSECLAFSRRVAEAIERSDPATFTTAFAKAGRERKILIDYLRNNRTNTSIAAYSARARTGAPVSAPIEWNDLGVRRVQYTIPTLTRRMKRLRRDPWRGYWGARQRVTDRALEALRRL
jgi:bifunctional non-homologous end joining protein LigD